MARQILNDNVSYGEQRTKINQNFDALFAGLGSGGVGLTPDQLSAIELAKTSIQPTDPRLSDARTPTTHSHSKSQISDFAHSHEISEVTGLQAALNNLASNIVSAQTVQDMINTSIGGTISATYPTI